MSEVPIVDIARLFDPDATADAVGAVDDAVGRAIAQAGGFVISGYPDAEAVDARARTMLSFFTLADAAKQALALRAQRPDGRRIYRGYIASLRPGAWAHNEFFDIGPDEPSPGPPLPGVEILSETTLWPEVEPVPGWQETMRAFYRHMHGVATAVMLSAGRAAGFADEDLQRRFEGGNSTLRLLNYPPPPQGHYVKAELADPDEDVESPALSAGRHTDGSGVSLLWQGQPGLQAQGPDGIWRDVPHVKNAISVHLGDVVEIMTAGAVPATPHRVLNLNAPRQSIGFFLEPGLGAQLSPLSESDSKSHSARGTYAWHLLRRLSSYPGFETLVPRPD